jgi:hypothetical protein
MLKLLLSISLVLQHYKLSGRLTMNDLSTRRKIKKLEPIAELELAVQLWLQIPFPFLVSFVVQCNQRIPKEKRSM